MLRFAKLILALCAALYSPAVFAQASGAAPVIPGYIASSGCPSTATTPCFVPFSGQSALNISAASVVKATAGRLVRVSVIVLGSTAGSCNDSATTGGAAQANQILAIPASAPVGSVYYLDFPTSNGIVCTPGASGVLAVSYD